MQQLKHHLDLHSCSILSLGGNTLLHRTIAWIVFHSDNSQGELEDAQTYIRIYGLDFVGSVSIQEVRIMDAIECGATDPRALSAFHSS